MTETEALKNGWYGIDLDATLAWHDGFVSVDHIGHPIPRMAARVRRMLDEGKDVRIFTARVDGGEVALARGVGRAVPGCRTRHAHYPGLDRAPLWRAAAGYQQEGLRHG